MNLKPAKASKVPQINTFATSMVFNEHDQSMSVYTDRVKRYRLASQKEVFYSKIATNQQLTLKEAQNCMSMFKNLTKTSQIMEKAAQCSDNCKMIILGSSIVYQMPEVFAQLKDLLPA